MAANAAAFAVLVVLITTQGRAQEDSAELSEGEPLESRARAVCPVSGASYHELRVAGFQLFASGRVHEAGRCFREALNLYLDRIGRVRAQPELNRGTSGEEGRAAVARIMSDPAAAAALGSETSNIVSADAPPDVPPRLDELPGRRAPSPRPRSPPPPFFRDEDERRAVAREYDAQLRAQRRSSDAFEPRSA